MTGRRHRGAYQPALAIAAKIKAEQPDADILFVGAAGRMETTLVPAAGYPIQTVDVRGFQRRLSVKNIGRNLSAAVHAVTAGTASAKDPAGIPAGHRYRHWRLCLRADPAQGGQDGDSGRGA